MTPTPTLADALIANLAAQVAFLGEEVEWGYLQPRDSVLDERKAHLRRAQRHRRHGDCWTLRRLARRYGV